MSKCECDTKKDIYMPQLATVNKVRMMNNTEVYLHILPDGCRFECQPGQFVEVSVAGVGEAPVTITSSPTLKDGFEIVVRRIGNVTAAIHHLKPGDKIGIRGPFGRGYPVDQMKGKDLVFICGGIGLAPQRSFIKYVLDNRSDYGKMEVLLGTKCYAQRLFQSEIGEWLRRPDIRFLETIDEADDCWLGDVGVVTTLIPKVKSDLTKAQVFICGPPVMYKFVLLALAEAGVPKENIYLNLERKMKCGVGKCGHCQINDHYVCMEGPVFRYSDLAATPEAI